MEIIAYSKYIRHSPRKLRLVADLVKKLDIEKALVKLSFLPKNIGAQPILLTLKSALSNAVNNAKLTPDTLKIKNILIEEGARLKRMDKAHGARFARGIRQKRMSHIKVILTDQK